MVRTFFKPMALTLAAVACIFGSAVESKADDIITVDKTLVDLSAIPLVLQAEAFWDQRIIGYSSEIPQGLRNQLSRLTISATIADIDGEGGVLGFAGPDATVSISVGDPTTTGRFYTLPVLASMTFDLADFPSLQADGALFDVVAHEMGHAIGVGSLWELNSLTGSPEGLSLTQFIGHEFGGKYALAAYRRDSPFRVAAYIPLEQGGGAGTAGGHWADQGPYFNQVFTGAFTKEFMTGFLSDLDPTTQTVVTAPKFYSETTFGSCADMGYAVINHNAELKGETGNGTGQWPKTTGPTTEPFNSNGATGDTDNLGFNLNAVKTVYRKDASSSGDWEGGSTNTNGSEDPYKLRNHSWAPKK